MVSLIMQQAHNHNRTFPYRLRQCFFSSFMHPWHVVLLWYFFCSLSAGSSKRTSARYQVHLVIQFGKVALISDYLVRGVDLCIGNMRQVYNFNALNFHLGILKEYGRIARIHGLFGVRTTSPDITKSMMTLLWADRIRFFISVIQKRFTIFS